MKRGKRALILAGVLAALVLVYAGVQKSVSQPENVTEESGTYALTAHTAEELTGLFCAPEVPEDFPGRGYCIDPDADGAYEIDLY